MPVKRSTKNGQPCYKWGNSGKCYAYTSNDKASRKRAREKALRQGRAIKVSQFR